MTWTEAGSVADARALLARAVLDRDAVAARLGTITLRPEQRAAASRLLTLVNRDGGALLADPVGHGKTYTALAVAKRVGAVLVVAPSSLRAMWTEALAACAMAADIATHEALSRGSRPATDARLVIVDEAHRFRSSGTRRYDALADVCRNRRVLLLSATPVQNRRADLSVMLALFLGRRAWTMAEAELAEHVVRSAAEHPDLPAQRGPFLLSLATEDACLDQLVALPSPVPARDESIPAALLVYSLLHQWTSSRAALVAALRRRQTRSVALLEALASGRAPTRQELAAWTHHGDAVQLAFPEIVTSDARMHDSDAMLLAVDRHAAAINALLRSLRSSPDPDDERAELLRHIRRDHPGERIIAFCQYTETVNAMRARLVSDPGVAALTAQGARIASGRVPRDIVLRQFRPGSAEVNEAERIDLLLTTDLLSEGLNLQEASVIVHLDFPWNPARLDQRVGRARRLGSRHAQVAVYAFAPPADSDRLLRIAERLRDKLRIAQRTIGVAGQILPSPIAAVASARSSAEMRGAIDDRLRRWRREGDDASHGVPLICSIEGGNPGVICALADGRIVVDAGRGLTTEPSAVDAALEALDEARAAVSVDGISAGRALDRIRAWLDADRGAATIDFSVASAARSRRRALDRVSQAMARAPRHRRAQFAELAAAARQVATAHLGEGAERILQTLLAADLPDEAWLRSVAMFGELNTRPSVARRPAAEPVVVVLIVRGAL